MKGGNLYLVPTLISPGTEQNVLNPQIFDVLTNIRLILCENLRSTRRYISSLKLGVPLEEYHLEQLNKNSEVGDILNWMQPLKEGKSIAVLSESGCPGIADPGSLAVELAHSLGLKVVPLVGPSSILLTLMASGMNGQRFTFHGYLPIQEREKQKAIKELERDSRKKDQTQLFIETPYRNQKMFQSLIRSCHPDTKLCLGSDLTGTNEYIKTLPIKKWKNEKPNLQKIPTVFALQA